MDSTNDQSSIKPIFYLDLKGRVTPLQVRISTKLAELGIPMVPIGPEDFIKIQQNQSASFVISLCNDFNSYKNFLLLRRRFLDMALVSGKISLLDVSSFGPVFLTNQIRNNSRYKHLSLPISLSDMMRELLMWYTNYQEKVQQWPGGRRARLPNGDEQQ